VVGVCGRKQPGGGVTGSALLTWQLEKQSWENVLRGRGTG
jgi:hypothetical protein